MVGKQACHRTTQWDRIHDPVLGSALPQVSRAAPWCHQSKGLTCWNGMNMHITIYQVPLAALANVGHVMVMWVMSHFCSFNPSVSNALPKCRAVTPFLFPSQYHCVVWESALPQKFCCVNLVFKGSVSLGESSDLNGSFHSLFLWSVNGSICVWLRHKIWVRTNPQKGDEK